MCSATMHWVVKYACPTLRAGKKKDLVKKAEDVFPNANCMNHINGSVF